MIYSIIQVAQMPLDEVKKIDIDLTLGEITRLATEIERFSPGFAKFMLAEPGGHHDTWRAGNDSVAWLITAMGSAMNSQMQLHYRAVLRKLAKQKDRN